MRLGGLECPKERRRNGRSHHADDAQALGVVILQPGNTEQKLKKGWNTGEDRNAVALDCFEQGDRVELVDNDQSATFVNSLVAQDWAYDVGHGKVAAPDRL